MKEKIKNLPTIITKNYPSGNAKDKHKLQQFFKRTSCRPSPTNSILDNDIRKVRATNFLSRINTLDSPSVIFAVSQQIKEMSLEKYNKIDIVKNRNEGKVVLNNLQQMHKSSQQRQSTINLCKWIDEKLSHIKNKTNISFSDIIQYKQIVLNYALGQIIDSLSKKCKQQGQLLSLIWNNTFIMFEGVFNILISSVKQKQIEHFNQNKQLHKIFQQNHDFLRQENSKLKKQNDQIFTKMLRVIEWNKRLRKERKQYSTQIKILEYKNYTYSQSLQQLIQMILKSSSQPVALQTAKKILSKLIKDKKRKKLNFKNQIQIQIKTQAKQIVYKWLQNNIYLADQALQLFKESNFTKQDGFMFSEIDDKNQIDKINIYDFFKLYDVGIQATTQTKDSWIQSDIKIFKQIQSQTNQETTVQNSCQTVNKHDNFQNQQKQNISVEQSKQKIITRRTGAKMKTYVTNKPTVFNQTRDKKTNKSNNFKPNNKVQKQIKQIKQNDDISSVNYFNQNQLIRKTKKQKTVKMQTFISNYQNQINQHLQQNSLSNSSENQIIIKKPSKNRILTLNTHQQRSSNQDKLGSQYKIFTYNQRGQQKRRGSTAYIKSSNDINQAIPLSKKKFSDTYKQNKQNMLYNKQGFVQRIRNRRSLYSRKKIQFANYKQVQLSKQADRQLLRQKTSFQPLRTQSKKIDIVKQKIQQFSKKISNSTIISKAKTLNNTQNSFSSIMASIQQIARIPSKNKVYVSNTITMIIKYFDGLFIDYLKQLRREREGLAIDFQKAIYPLQVLLMQAMNFKYGLKDISQKKLKEFVQKVLTYEAVSEKVNLYSLLLGLQDEGVGADQLLVYLKCLVYFQSRKTRDVSDRSMVDIELVRENIKKVLQYFFDNQYINLLEVKLQMYFQQSAPFTTIQGISIIIIKQLLKRKKQLRFKYAKIHEICSFGASFYLNLFKLLKLFNQYKNQAMNNSLLLSLFEKKRQMLNGRRTSSILRASIKSQIKNICQYDDLKIGRIIQEIIKRSDIIDDQYGKSITLDKFLPVAQLNNIPSQQDLQLIFEQFKLNFGNIVEQSLPIISPLNWQKYESVQKLSQIWCKQQNKKTQNSLINTWSISRMIHERVQENISQVMGRLGVLGSHVQNCLLNLSIM